MPTGYRKKTTSLPWQKVVIIKSSKPKDRHMVRPDFNNQTEHCFSYLGIKYRNYERCANSIALWSLVRSPLRHQNLGSSPFLSEKFIQAIREKFQFCFLFLCSLVGYFCRRRKILKDAKLLDRRS